MSALVFVDTNVVVYRFDRTEAEKPQRAKDVRSPVGRTAGRVSTQVLHETYAIRTRELGMPAAEVRQLVRALQAWNPVVLDQRVLSGRGISRTAGRSPGGTP